MNSMVVPASISHERFLSKSHRFEYRFMLLILDLDELKDIDRSSKLFGYNRLRPISIFDKDYLTPGIAGIKSKLADLLRKRASINPDPDARVLLLTSGRAMGHVFNPVSFYFLYTRDGYLQTCVAEVNNTFGDKHVYILGSPDNPQQYPVKFRAEKAFHVSPFFDISGEYAFSFSDIRKDIDISIILIKNSRPALEAKLRQSAPPEALQDSSFLKTWLFHPLAPNMTYPRILRQAAKLYFGKGLPVYTRPEPENPMTIRTMHDQTGLLDRMARRLVLANLNKIRKGRLEMQMPDNTVHVFGQNESGPSCRIQIRDRHFFRKILKSEDVGLGEAYAMGMWTTDDLTMLMELLIMNMDSISYMEDWGLPGRALHKLMIPARKMIPDNDIQGSRRNIQVHYDLSNEFFSCFLDPTMTYSCAVFENPGEMMSTGKRASSMELKKAQEHKYATVAKAAGISSGQTIVEIGCGWGGFALYAARELECIIHAVTISRNQHSYVKDKVNSHGLTDRIKVIFDDYRKLQGCYDALVSIEMLEAVGHKYHPHFFATVDRLLKPGGRACIQTITIMDQRYEAYRKTRDWISTYIFPGGLLPSLNRITSVLSRHTSLSVSGIKDIGLHYGPTLAAWRERFMTNWNSITALSPDFDDSFRRTWQYYFCSCQAAFNQRHIRNLQITLDRPKYSNRQG